jgi:hypothetical protein
MTTQRWENVPPQPVELPTSYWLCSTTWPLAWKGLEQIREVLK